MTNFFASVAYGVVALALLALRFYMTSDNLGVALVTAIAVLAWASCYCMALYEQSEYGAFVIAGIGLTGGAVAVGLFTVVRAVLA